MRRRAAIVGLALLLAGWLAWTAPGPASAAAGEAAGTLTMAVIGETPYGDQQLAAFPSLVEDVNDDRTVGRVLHFGDIKTGSSVCSDRYFATIFTLFETFSDPIVFTPGDIGPSPAHRLDELQRLLDT